MSKLKVECEPGAHPDKALEPDLTITHQIETEEIHIAYLDVDDGRAEIKVTILERNEDGEGHSVIELEIDWRGACEQPENLIIRWVHFVSYLSTELPQYLLAYCPGPTKEIIRAIELILPSDIRQEWDLKSEEVAV